MSTIPGTRGATYQRHADLSNRCSCLGTYPEERRSQLGDRCALLEPLYLAKLAAKESSFFRGYPAKRCMVRALEVIKPHIASPLLEIKLIEINEDRNQP
jgi:hypothetical protein